MTRILFLALAFFATAPAIAAPKAELWPKWQANDASSTIAVDHAPWGRFLAAYVKESPDGINRVAYGAVTPQDKQALAAYVDALTKVPVSKLNRNEQRAYWVNLYNALTVKTVLEHYPVESIRKISISPGLFSSGPWGKKLVNVEGEEIALDDIEHRILRPIWRDPRIHYAVNCASIGCPNLMREPFTAANADQLLEAGARAYVNNPRGAEAGNGRLVVSSIYVWFQDDFGGNDAGVIQHLKRYAGPELQPRLAQVSKINDDRYDWGLNDAKPR
jgi:hypothetical protein